MLRTRTSNHEYSEEVISEEQAKAFESTTRDPLQQDLGL